MRRGDPDADSGEAAGADADQDRCGLSALDQLREHRHQPLGMAAADPLVGAREAVPAAVEQAAVQASLDVSNARIMGR